MPREIKLSKGAVAIVDEDDYDRVRGYAWFLNDKDKVHYAMAGVYKPSEKRQRTVTMHRLIIGARKGQIVDHVNGDGLDNRKCNLRTCGPKGNAQNRRKVAGSGTNYKGVYHHIHVKYSICGKFSSRIYVNHKRKFLGYFSSAEEAAIAYDEAARKYFKDFAYLNFPNKNAAR